MYNPEEGTDIAKEIELMEANIRSLEDAVKRLDALPKEAFSKEHQSFLIKMQGRLFDLTK